MLSVIRHTDFVLFQIFRTVLSGGLTRAVESTDQKYLNKRQMRLLLVKIARAFKDFEQWEDSN